MAFDFEFELFTLLNSSDRFVFVSSTLSIYSTTLLENMSPRQVLMCLFYTISSGVQYPQYAYWPAEAELTA